MIPRRAFLQGALCLAVCLGAFTGAGLAQDAKPPVAIGLAPITDWSTQQPFLDVMKTARRWIGHEPGRWGGRSFEALEASGLLDDEGWPMSKPSDLGAIGTLILTDMPEGAGALAGRYLLRFEGEGIVEVSGRATNVRYGRGEVTFDYTPGPGPVEIRIQRSDPARTGDYVRSITVVKDEHVAAFDAGAVFRPAWLDMLDGFEALRFMDWMNTNDHGPVAWEARARVSDFSYTRHGAPVEIMSALAAEVGADLWINIPHLADDAYVRTYAEALRAVLPEGSRAYVEFSNELWNWQFLQTEWADAQGQTRWGIQHRGAQFYGMRAAEVADIFSDVFAQDRARLINVIATQTAWLGLETDVLGAPLAVQEGQRPPHEAFDAYAVTGYFGHVLGTERRAELITGWLAASADAAEAEGRAQGLAGVALDMHMAKHRFDLATQMAAEELIDGRHSGDPDDTLTDLLDRVLPYHAEVAARHGLDLIMYEGGTHVVGIGTRVDDDALTAFFTHLNYAPQMGAIYDALMAGWAASTPGIFNVFTDVQAASKWGSWGALRYPGDTSARWQVIERRK
ncbi:hypothetical protein KUD11_11615 [Roseovarius sp. LXJ103]|uniref:hypothetical protein n=1 Tax=Roseovarius carneus TaxID=2853164 RepID=UPI000D6102FC|nr:hypothetical protein [Roseovarius carneus]MBZ8119289.1 hypothetical protein [Roseovarius carneus]PWE35092.1 hypothetical protein DD563_03370 [Pelagicola sp. LXJ1103]